MPPKSNFFDKLLGRLGRLDAEGLHNVVHRLASERSFLETLFNTIEDGVLVADLRGRILYYNRAVTQLIGVPEAEPDNQMITDYLPELDWPQLCRPVKGGGERIVRRELEVTYPRPRFLRLYAAPLEHEAGGGPGVALILHDATEAREKTFAAIESERVQALTLLAASVAHELGNPLNALHIHLQLMEREVRKLRGATGVLTAPTAGSPAGRGGARRGGAGAPAPTASAAPDYGAIADKLDKYLAVARGEIDRLDYIITEFLQAMRPTPPQLKAGSLNDVVARTLALLRPELDNRNLVVRERLARHLPSAPMDQAQLQQVLVNLIKNAMQAMTRGGTLTLCTGEGTDGVWVSVEDTGNGIPQEQINRIFEPFYTTKEKGSGLGLMIVQRIIRAHGGRIELESHVGRGTTFRVWLPQRRLLAASPPPASAADEPTA